MEENISMAFVGDLTAPTKHKKRRSRSEEPGDAPKNAGLTFKADNIDDVRRAVVWSEIIHRKY
jgi:hypothetical protein